MSRIIIKRQLASLPPIESIHFETVKGNMCLISKTVDDEFVITGIKDDAIARITIDRETMLEVYECLGEMLEGK